MCRDKAQQQETLKSTRVRELVRKMLKSDPRTRPSALEILEDEWVVEGHPKDIMCDTEEAGEAAYSESTLASNELEVCQVSI